MIFKVLLLLLLGLGLLPLGAAAQPATLTLKQQEEDFAIFRRGLQEGHGGLYYFIKRTRFEQQCDSVGRTFRNNDPLGSYYLKLRYLLTLLGHGHSRLNLTTRNEEFRLGLLQPQQRYLPLELRILNNRLYALTDCSDEQALAPGTEILGINGIPAHQLIATMLRYVPADGRNTTFKYYNLTNYYAFHFLYNLLYPQATDFALTVRGARPPVRLRGQLPAAIAQAYRARTGRGISYYGAQLAYQPALARGVAYLRVSSFYKGLIERGGRRFEPFIDSVFSNMKSRGTQNLVLDLRNNEGGGDGYAEYLFAHLTNQPFMGSGPDRVAGRRFTTLQYVRNQSDELKAFAADPNQFLRDDTTLVLKPEFAQEAARKPAAAQPYLGRLYVLTNGGTFSAANHLIGYLCRQRQATGRAVLFVGEENGGDVYSNVLCAGQSYVVKLPHSGIEVDMPFLCGGQLNRTPPAKRLPDLPIEPSIQDIVQGRDTQLQFVLKRVRRRY